MGALVALLLEDLMEGGCHQHIYVTMSVVSINDMNPSCNFVNPKRFYISQVQVTIIITIINELFVDVLIALTSDISGVNSLVKEIVVNLENQGSKRPQHLDY